MYDKNSINKVLSNPDLLALMHVPSSDNSFDAAAFDEADEGSGLEKGIYLVPHGSRVDLYIYGSPTAQLKERIPDLTDDSTICVRAELHSAEIDFGCLFVIGDADIIGTSISEDLRYQTEAYLQNVTQSSSLVRALPFLVFDKI